MDFTEFKLSSGISINPFRMIDEQLAADDDDYLVDCLAMLKSIISQMARNETRLNDTEREPIAQAVNIVWDEYSRDGLCRSYHRSFEAGRASIRLRSGDIAAPVRVQGDVQQFLLGDANLDLSADLTVFELSDLATRERIARRGC